MLETINHSGYINIRRKYNCVKKDYAPLNTDCVVNIEPDSDVSLDNCGQNAPSIEEPCLDLTRHFAYDFKSGDLLIHAFEYIPEINGQNCIIGQGFDNKPYLFCSQLPVDMWGSIYPQTFHHKIDFVVKGYEIGSTYTEAIFDFQEFQYFVPSTSVVTEEEDSTVIKFSRNAKEITSFDVTIDSTVCHAALNVTSKGKWGLAHSNMEAYSEIRISFPETADLEFINKVYNLVDCVFAFICNRRNTTCLSMKIKGKYPSKGINNGKIVDVVRDAYHEVFFFNRYREEPEDNKVISKTWDVSFFLKHIDNLFKLVACNITDKSVDVNGENERPLSIASIHPSVKRRNLVDLQQSLQISSSFELYARHYLPPMVKEETHHIVMRIILDELINRSSGKLKELAKSLSKGLVREPALEDKIWKAYKGYDTWKTLKLCISEEWYKEQEIKELGYELRLWRNALAHGKLNYEPSEKTIRAVRLLEHINYSIILREIGYEDEEIKSLLDRALKR